MQASTLFYEIIFKIAKDVSRVDDFYTWLRFTAVDKSSGNHIDIIVSSDYSLIEIKDPKSSLLSIYFGFGSQGIADHAKLQEFLALDSLSAIRQSSFSAIPKIFKIQPLDIAGFATQFMRNIAKDIITTSWSKFIAICGSCNKTDKAAKLVCCTHSGLCVLTAPDLHDGVILQIEIVDKCSSAKDYAAYFAFERSVADIVEVWQDTLPIICKISA